MSRRAFVRLCCAGTLALVGGASALACTNPASCPIPYLADVADHIASKIPLNTQSDCAGYSRVNNTQAVSPSPLPALCAADPGDGACIACLRAACCDDIAVSCIPDGGPALDAATCAEVPAVRVCIVAAVNLTCAVECAPPDGGT